MWTISALPYISFAIGLMMIVAGVSGIDRRHTTRADVLQLKLAEQVRLNLALKKHLRSYLEAASRE